MGCLPLERTTNFMGGSECVESYNNVAMSFNDKLKGLVEELNKELPGARVVLSNPYPIMMQIVQKPSSYGFEDTAVACCATGMFEMGYACARRNPFTCMDANKFVFWDSFHPTEKTNRIIADHMMKTYLSSFL
ncbi:Li-tolerant lipase 1 [Actinidia rufa]|uniref:Li-tolerant lipase 1 n=1 Tax=Actinidia rufa TaxID=165716 RepID=A0A7J0EX75_9ERIC|nr:Li-tolerant lipase 1 [Actinidia rufa]